MIGRTTADPFEDDNKKGNNNSKSEATAGATADRVELCASCGSLCCYGWALFVERRCVAGADEEDDCGDEHGDECGGEADAEVGVIADKADDTGRTHITKQVDDE